MNRDEYLMVVASEECAEIQYNISKAIRFGVDNHHPDKPEVTNGYQIMKEYYQLMAVMGMLASSGYVPEISKTDVDKIYFEKVDAVKKWMEYSMEIGKVSE